MSSARLAWAAGAALLIASTPAPADDLPSRYDGWKAVRLDTPTPAALARARGLDLPLLSCHEALGTTDYLVAPERLPALAASGLTFTLLADDVQDSLDAFEARMSEIDAQDGAGFYESYRDLATINDRLATLVQDHPLIASIADIGDSIEGRDLLMLRISGPGGGEKPAVLFNGCQHAREWISPMTVMFLAEHLITRYGVDPQVTALMDEIEFFVIVVVNPDGFQYSWDEVRLWRKNRRDNGDGTIGVDLNRNWGFEWGGEGASPDPGNDLYHGPTPFSEPETTALAAFYQAHPNIVASIDFHNYGQLALYPWAWIDGGPDDDGAHESVALDMVDAIYAVHGRTYVQGPVFDVLYAASGGSVDWTWGDQGVVSYTIELRDKGQFGFLLPPDQIIPTIEENLPAALALAERVAKGASITPVLPGAVASDTPQVVPVKIIPLPHVEIDAATGRLHARVGDSGPFAVSPLVALGGAEYEATLPAAPCGETIELYFEIESVDGRLFVEPGGAPDERYTVPAWDFTLALDDDFESDQGWSVENIDLTGGAWERGVPAGTGERGDPTEDYDGSGACYLTENNSGNSDVDGGPTRLVSPLIDLSQMIDPRLEYAIWFANDDQDGDRLKVELSDDAGVQWTGIESAANTNGWVHRSVELAAFIDLTSAVRVRFGTFDNPNNSVTEAAVDAVRIVDYGCTVHDGDVDGDGDVDFDDLLLVLDAWGDCPAPPATCPADLDGSGVVDLADVLAVRGNWSE